jgi:hypothetical protein
MTPGTLVCSDSSMVRAPERATSAAVTVETLPGTLPTAISLPATGDTLTNPASILLGIATVGDGRSGVTVAEGAVRGFPGRVCEFFRAERVRLESLGVTTMGGKASGCSACAWVHERTAWDG